MIVLGGAGRSGCWVVYIVLSENLCCQVAEIEITS